METWVHREPRDLLHCLCLADLSYVSPQTSTLFLFSQNALEACYGDDNSCYTAFILAPGPGCSELADGQVHVVFIQRTLSAAYSVHALGEQG